jgi:transmembrane sensor
MTNQEAKQLIVKYNKGKCTAAEKALLDRWYEQLNNKSTGLSEAKIQQISEDISKKLPKRPGEKDFKLWSVLSTVAAASIIALGTWMFNQKQEIHAISDQVQDVKPGGNAATITFSNGKKILLSPDQKSVIVGDHQLSYNDGSLISQDNDNNERQKISIPNGGQYQIVLSDGTRVWLNSASTLEYPLQSSKGPTRKVVLQGEAYFEVAKDSKHPFIVVSGSQHTTVLGTHFNVNAYPDQPIKTTLLEGSVRVSTSGTQFPSRTIKPGEQSVFTKNGLQISNADPDLEIAWKNGKTEFEDAELKTVMNMLSRWYDVNVDYKFYPSEARFTGSVSRSKNISEVLQLLESTEEVHFKVEGRKVLVMK